MNVPIYICGGDIRGVVTKTDLFVTIEEAEGVAVDGKQESDKSTSSAVNNSVVSKFIPGTSKLDCSFKCGNYWRRITQRYHHRFITDEIGKPLNAFTTSKHMMQVVSNAFTAHRQAYELAGVIHRDVSSNNILITFSRGGILNDWDMAKTATDHEKGPPCQYERTGTWEFMSCLLLSGHHTINTIQDNMESFVLIILYHALRYFPHNRKGDTRWILDSVFNTKVPTEEGYRGYEGRRALFTSKIYIGRDFKLFCSPLHRWMKAAIAAVKEWIDTEEAARRRPEPVLVHATGGLLTYFDALGSCSEESSESPAPPLDIPPRYLDDHTALAEVCARCLIAHNWPDPNKDMPVDILPLLEAEQKPLPREAGTKESSGTGGSIKRNRSSTDIGRTGESSKRRKISTTKIAGPGRKSTAF
ncbi:hypothetical protein DXG01_017193 [Tephrocybe rancida]|nr:hypothetical protein DXG01_017193 [Tephrocybe rancida]